jgi:hypothetical protein
LGRFYVEELVELPGPGGMSDDTGIWGRLDLAWIDVDTLDLHVADLKSAENPERNHLPQLLAYAAGMVRHLHLEGPRNVVLHMIYADSSKMTTTTLDIGDASTEYLADYLRIAEIGRGKACEPRQCGWCDLCARFTSCPAMQAVAEKASPRLADAAKPERWADFTSEQKARLCALADTLSRWCEAVRDYASEDAKAGECIADPANAIYFGLQERKGRLLIKDVRQTWEVVKPYLTAEGYRRCLSVSQVEIRDALRRTGMKASDVTAMLERCGTRLPPTTVFVRKSAEPDVA